ncbi:MAG: ribosome maturation factor RimP [Bacteroidota bacterium]
MPSIPEKIREILQPITDSFNAFIVEIVLRGERSSKVIEVYIDSDKGISLEECSDISRELSMKLDELDLISGRYRLDVSSPGLDRPLKLLRQYSKNIGRNCKVKYTAEGKKIVQEGILEQVAATAIVIKKGGKLFEIPFPAINETYIIPRIT